MTYPELYALPFHVSHALYRVHGLLRLESDRLVIECQPVENILGLVRGPLRVIEVPFLEVAEISLGKGPLGGKLLSLRTFYLQTLRRFPGAHEGEVQLRIRRTHVQLAEDFVNRVELELTEASLRHLEASQNPSLPPPPLTRAEQVLQIWDGIKALMKKIDT